MRLRQQLLRLRLQRREGGGWRRAQYRCTGAEDAESGYGEIAEHTTRQVGEGNKWCCGGAVGVVGVVGVVGAVRVVRVFYERLWWCVCVLRVLYGSL